MDYKFKGKTTEEVIDQKCEDLAKILKKINKFDRTLAWDQIHTIGRIIDDAYTYLMLYGALDEEES